MREICGGLASCEGKLKHIGVPQAPSKSTLAYANEHRPWPLYQKVFGILFARCQQAAGAGHRFRFRNPLLSIDGTLIDLCVTMFDWAQYQQGKGAAKLHLVLDHDGYLPRYAVITEGKVSEVKIACDLQFAPGTILVFDRGYVDYPWYQRLTASGVFFVTRLRHDAHYQVLQELAVRKNRHILKDQIIALGSHHYRQTAQFRRAELWLEDRQEVLVLLSNHLDFGSTTIEQIYRERWRIEIFIPLPEAEPADQNFCGHICQRPAHPNLDSTDSHAAAEIPATARSLRLVTIESGRPAAPTAFRLS